MSSYFMRPLASITALVVCGYVDILRAEKPTPSSAPPTSTAKPSAASSLDDELFKGLDDAVTAPGIKPQPAEAARSTTAPETKPPAGPDAKQTGTAPIRKPNSADPLDAELLRQLEGAGGATPPKSKSPAAEPSDRPPGSEGDAGQMPESDDPFQRLSERIRDAERRLTRSDGGDQTQELQRRIVEDLDKLISQIEQQRQQQHQSDSQSSKPQGKKPQPGAPQPQPGQPGGRTESDSQQARDSREGTRNTTRRAADPAALKSLLEKAWGRLPERERQDVMQSSVDDFPAKYQFVIEEYFKSLLQRRD